MSIKNSSRGKCARSPRENPGARGFSLVEVLVALVVVSIGLLGLAKMESLAMASTTVAGKRSMVAIQAASLAAMMHANQDYWQNSTVSATTIVNNTNNFSTAQACTTAGATACNPVLMANYDLKRWAAALAALLGNTAYQATITCTQVLPITCTIAITWAENMVSMEKQQSNVANVENLGGLGWPTYTMYVQP